MIVHLGRGCQPSEEHGIGPSAASRTAVWKRMWIDDRSRSLSYRFAKIVDSAPSVRSMVSIVGPMVLRSVIETESSEE